MFLHSTGKIAPLHHHPSCQPSGNLPLAYDGRYVNGAPGAAPPVSLLHHSSQQSIALDDHERRLDEGKPNNNASFSKRGSWRAIDQFPAYLLVQSLSHTIPM